MRTKWTLANKLMAIAGSAIGVTLLAFTGLSGWMAAEHTNEQVLLFAQEKAAGVTAQTSVQIIDAVSAGNALAATLSGLMSSGPMRKADTVVALRTVLERYPNLFGTWMSDTTDRRSERYLTGSGYHNAAGVFTPYWTKQNDGTVAFDTFAIEPSEAWYRDPIATGKSLLVEPYVTTQGQLVTSVSAPLTVNGTIVGVAGVDIRLSGLAEMLAAMHPFEDGRVMMLSNAGKWIVPPEGGLLMKEYAGPGMSEVKAARR